MVSIVGVRAMPTIDRRDDGVTVEAEGVRLTLRGADVRAEGDTVRVTFSRRR